MKILKVACVLVPLLLLVGTVKATGLYFCKDCEAERFVANGIVD